MPVRPDRKDAPNARRARHDSPRSVPDVVAGVLVVDKPEGVTSHDVVAVARRVLREKRIGHTGTLDPLATGVLPLACGQATRLVRFLTASDKTYVATVRFGVTTDTYDITGEETSRTPGAVSRDAVTSALRAFMGEQRQTPPPYSAKKVDGIRAYALARRSEPVVLEPVTVRVAELTLEEHDGERAIIRLTVSAGYYVRSFAHALGLALGTGACLEALRRTRSGEFGLESAVTLDELLAAPDAAAEWVIAMHRLLVGMPAVVVTEEGRLRVSHGRPLDAVHYSAAARGDERRPDDRGVRMLDEHGQLVAIGQLMGAETLHPQVVLI